MLSVSSTHVGLAGWTRACTITTAYGSLPGLVSSTGYIYVSGGRV